MSPSTIIRHNERVEYRSLGEGNGGVLLRLDTGAYHGINEVGELIWRRAAGATFTELVSILRDELDDAPAQLEVDVARFLEELSARGLVTLDQSEQFPAQEP